MVAIIDTKKKKNETPSYPERRNKRQTRTFKPVHVGQEGIHGSRVSSYETPEGGKERKKERTSGGEKIVKINRPCPKGDGKRRGIQKPSTGGVR